MIAPLRLWHRRCWWLLAIALPLLILLAISQRQEVPAMDSLPPGVADGGGER